MVRLSFFHLVADGDLLLTEYLYFTLLDIPVNHIYVAKATENNGCQSTDVPLRPFNAALGSHPGVICTHTDVII